MRSFKRQTKIQLALVGAIALVGTACSDRQEEQATVIDRNYTRESQTLGETAAREGEAEVTGQREIVERRVERVEESVPTIVTGQKQADLNRMGVEDFRAIGIAEPVAKNIIQYRDKLPNERFTSIEQLRQVPGVDAAWLSKYKPLLGVGPVTAE